MAPSPSGEPRLRQPRGAARLGCLLLALIGAAAVYVGVLVLKSEIDFRSLQNRAEQEARISETRSDDEIRQTLVARARELGLPRTAERVGIQRFPGGDALITIAYPDTVTFLGRWSWIRMRRISVRGPF